MNLSTPDQRYRQEVLRDAPLIYWPLDRTAYAQDFRPTASPNVGTVYGTASPGAGAFGGGQSIRSDGSTTTVAIPYNAAFNGATWTAEIWVYITTLDANNQYALNDTKTFSDGWSVRFDGTGATNRWRLDMWGVDSVSSLAPPLLNQWQHLVVQSRSGSTLMWINGAVQGQSIFSPATNSTAYFNASGLNDPLNAGTGLAIKGSFAHVAYYPSFLSPARIAAHYAAGRVPAPTKTIVGFTTRPAARRINWLFPEDDFLFRPRRAFIGSTPFRLITPRIFRPEHIEDIPYRMPCRPRMIDFGKRFGAVRGLYRIANATDFKFYRNNTRPPLESDTPFATSATLPSTPANTYADGVWYLSISYFNGFLDSGFLPLGPHGETYLRMELSAGAAIGTRPSAPVVTALELRAGGVVRVSAVYARVPDGPNAATEWSIGYTTDGTTPPNDTPTVTEAMTGGPLQRLAFNLPAQADGTTVKVQLQTRKGTLYSVPGTVLVAIADAAGPTAPTGIGSWVGGLPEAL